MDPKSNAASSLSSISNSINTGMNFGNAPQYTPAGTPPVMPPEPAPPVHTYTPPSFGIHTPPPAVAVQTAPQPTLQPQPSITVTPQLPTSYQVPQQPIVPPLTTAYPAATTIVPIATPSVTQPHLTSRGLRTFILTLFILGLLIVTGLLYLYGSLLVSRQSTDTNITNQNPALGTPEGLGIPTEIPTNGFQVTESGINEPNFDQQSPLDSLSAPTTSGVNTDIEQMFAE